MWLRLLILCLCLISLLFITSDACSCAPVHPQEKYCTSSFAVKATVGNRRTVIIDENGQIIVLDKYGRVKQSKITEEEQEGSGGSDDFPSLPLLGAGDMFAGERPNFISEAVGPDSRIPGYSPHFKGINAQLSKAIQLSRAKRGSGRRQKKTKNRLSGSRHPPGLRKPPPPPKFAKVPVGRKMMQYTITVLKDYKNSLNGEKHHFLYTPPPPLCNVNLKKNHTVYLLMGKIRNNRMEIESCDYKTELNDLDEIQRQNLLRNLRLRYKCENPECQIRVCNRETCAQAGTNECVWLDWRTTFHPDASQFACKKKRTGQCEWYNGAKEKMKPEDIELY